ncbi:MAG TPA: hypothetical protein VKA54_13535 [Gemmatimonadaceae bacterium]|nr:hypothetical protein [Gemmatimonadaceae bacterium]
MPGYRSLSAQLSGTAAEHAREAELRQRGGDPDTAARLLEEALDASLRVRPEMPGWICGRLASIYRTLKRYDDEVDLLERYRESQTSEEARTRFDARLSKARAVAERKRRPVTGALETVRQVRHRSSQRRRTPSRAQLAIAGTRAMASRDAELRAALADLAPDSNERLRDALAGLCAQAHATDTQMEHLVSRLKNAWTETPLPSGVTPEDWQARYSAALVELLAIYFGEPA